VLVGLVSESIHGARGATHRLGNLLAGARGPGEPVHHLHEVALFHRQHSHEPVYGNRCSVARTRSPIGDINAALERVGKRSVGSKR